MRSAAGAPRRALCAGGCEVLTEGVDLLENKG